MTFHDFSPHSDACVNCGTPRAGSSVECVPTAAEPGCDTYDVEDARDE
jgi:hypothetical protein